MGKVSKGQFIQVKNPNLKTRFLDIMKLKSRNYFVLIRFSTISEEITLPIIQVKKGDPGETTFL